MYCKTSVAWTTSSDTSVKPENSFADFRNDLVACVLIYQRGMTRASAIPASVATVAEACAFLGAVMGELVATDKSKIELVDALVKELPSCSDYSSVGALLERYFNLNRALTSHKYLTQDRPLSPGRLEKTLINMAERLEVHAKQGLGALGCSGLKTAVLNHRRDREAAGVDACEL